MKGRLFINSCLLRQSIAVTVLAMLITGTLGEQYFTERPKDSNAIRGQTAVLKCSVGDRKGAVQWTKDGFSLGFNHTVPGYPRYTITSSYEDQFDLQIVNAQLEDDADYECQVLPKDGDGRLQARAKLTVLVPCSAPRVLGYNNGSTVEVSHRQNSLELTCESSQGRPAAQIQWFRNGQKVSENVRYNVESMASNDKLKTARSTLTISLNNSSEENGAVYSCEAKNEAVFGPPAFTQVTLSILFPPGPPQISGYGGGPVRVNETLFLACRSRGGNPLGSVTWYRNNVPIDRSYTSGRNQAINDYTLVVSPRDNGAQYECRVKNVVQEQPLTDSYTLQVNFPPSQVTMTGVDGPIRSGRMVTFTCVTSNANPRATVTWFAKTQQVPQHKVTETYRESPEGGTITTSQIRVRVTHEEHGAEYMCQASNSEFSSTVTDTTVLSVLYPPNPPEISNYEEGTALRAGNLKRITCLSVGGNPFPTLEWFKGDQPIPEADFRVVSTMVSSEIAIPVQPDDNGARYTCKAQNDATPVPLTVSVTLTVNFPPASVSITVDPPQPRVGVDVTLMCTSESSNPASDIVWLRNNVEMTGVNLGSTDGENGGKKSTNRLRVPATSQDHGAVYECRATNRQVDQSVSDAVTLSILFKPEFNKETLPSKIDVREGERTSINLTARANPPDVTYSLYRGGVAMVPLPDRFALVQGVLNITALEKDDRGSYVIMATNSQGNSTYEFSLNVKYSAKIVDISKNLSVNEGDSAVLMCKVDANPIIPNIVTWTGGRDFDMTRATVRQEGDTTFLSIPDLQRPDSGMFKCVADNRIGAPATDTVRLTVKFKPIIDNAKMLTRSAAEIGKNATLLCRGEGQPKVSVMWTRSNNKITTSRKFYIREDTSTREGTFESQLTVRAVTESDYGAYVCTASNSRGSDSLSIALSNTSKPLPPTDLRQVNATSGTITLQWAVGFNGGKPQSFRIMYKAVESPSYREITVGPMLQNEEIATYKVTGLALGTEYEFKIQSFNSLGSSAFANGIKAKTSDVLTPADIATSELQGSDEIPVIIILVVCIVGVFILALNVGLILFFIQRRKKRNGGASDTHTNTFELYGPSDKGDHLYPPPSDDMRSYGTYDKSMDDFSDDYIREYDIKPDIYPQSVPQVQDYNFVWQIQTNAPERPGSRPYSPAQQSPHHSHKLIMMEDDYQTAWREDQYKALRPRSPIKPVFENGGPNGDIYQYRSVSHPKNMNDLDRPVSRPSSRAGKTPPPPPTRSTSQAQPPIPDRNYDPQDLLPPPQPRYGPTPGSSMRLSPNLAVHQQSYSGDLRSPISPRHTPSPNDTLPVGAEFRGHLV